MLSNVCFDLSLSWQLPNYDIAFENSQNITKYFFTLIKNITTCAHMIQLCCTLLCTSVYNYVQLQSLIYCLLWLIYIVFGILNLNSYYTIGMYYICPGLVFQREFNCDDYFIIGLTSSGNFENWQICICILHRGKMFVTVRKCFEYPHFQKNL